MTHKADTIADHPVDAPYAGCRRDVVSENREMPELQKLVSVARTLFAVDAAYIALVERGRQSIAAYSGDTLLSAAQVSALCARASIGEGVHNSEAPGSAGHFQKGGADGRVTSTPFFAAAPLLAQDGRELGRFCIAAGTRPGLSQSHRTALVELASLAVEQVHLHQDDYLQSTTLNFANATDLSLISIEPSGTIEFVNPSATSLFGYTREEMIGSPIEIIIPERMRGAHSAGLARVAAGGEARLKGKTVEVSARRKDGSEFPIEITLSTWRDERGLGAGAIIKDISERRERDAKLLRLASQDPLTGLCNRYRFEDLLKAEMAIGGAAVILLDLDGFKEVNDTMGHAMGDSLLQAIAVRLPYVLRASAIVARFAGDEFAVLLPGIRDEQETRAEAEEILRAFQKPFDIGGHIFQLGVSIGMAIGPDHGSDEEEVLASADFALYRAKQEGAQACLMFDLAMHNETQARRALRDELVQALRYNELVLHYQPQVYMDTGEIFGAEALIRWQHPQRGLLYPGSFLPALEQSSLALEVGWWVLDQACHQLARWRDAGHSPIKMGVNLFPIQVRDPRMVERVSDTIAKYSIDPQMLELEVTETVALHDDDRALEVLTAIRALKVGIAFDDFGTGYASLSSLQRYPLTTLKIDRGFVRDLLTKPRDTAITRALITLSTDLGLETIAEGIETPEQEIILRKLGCRAGQGYFYGKPMSSEDMGARLSSSLKSPALVGT